jgi:hypothetical protein
MGQVNPADVELKYHDITELYELAEDLIDTVESEFIANPEDQLSLVEPLIEAVGDAADILSEEFLAVVGNSKAANKAHRGKIEGALRKIYVAIDAYKQRASHQASRSKQALINIADPIVERIKRQVEVIVALFVDFVDLTLDRIMQKTYIDELKKRQEKIAVMLHNLNQERGLDPV